MSGSVDHKNQAKALKNPEERPDWHPDPMAGKPAWQKGFVGRYLGNVGDQAYFSSHATGGGETDSLAVAWAGREGQKGRRMAVMPREYDGDVVKSAHVWDLDDADDANSYGHLPGYKETAPPRGLNPHQFGGH